VLDYAAPGRYVLFPVTNTLDVDSAVIRLAKHVGWFTLHSWPINSSVAECQIFLKQPPTVSLSLRKGIHTVILSQFWFFLNGPSITRNTLAAISNVSFLESLKNSIHQRDTGIERHIIIRLRGYPEFPCRLTSLSGYFGDRTVKSLYQLYVELDATNAIDNKPPSNVPFLAPSQPSCTLFAQNGENLPTETGEGHLGNATDGRNVKKFAVVHWNMKIDTIHHQKPPRVR